MSTRRIDSKLAQAMKAEYIKGNTNIDALAAKYNVKASTLKARIYREDWDHPSEDEIVEEIVKLPPVKLKERAKELNLDPSKIENAVKGLAKLDEDLQAQAQLILDIANTKIDIESSVGDLKSILDINIAIRNAYFNSKNAAVVVNNNTNMSSTSLSFFQGARRDEI